MNTLKTPNLLRENKVKSALRYHKRRTAIAKRKQRLSKMLQEHMRQGYKL